jgi:AraC family transcriptional activator of pyochelin receptor
MNTTLRSHSSGEIKFSGIIPPSLLKLIIKGAKPTAATGPFGDFLFQEMQSPEAVVWYNNYLLTKDDRFTDTGKLPEMELQFGLNNSFSSQTGGLGARKLHDGSFNLVYVPFVETELDFEKGRIYTTLDVLLTPALVILLAQYFPVLDSFLEKVAKQEAAVLCALDQSTTHEMKKIIDAILGNPYSGGTQKFYISTKVTELLIVVLEKITHYPTLHRVFFPKEEIEKIYAAKDELLGNLDKSITLLILSRKVGLNMTKLKIGFRQLYGSSIATFRLNARMKEATTRLNDTADSVGDICYALGYANPQHFSKTFSKYYGYTPTQLRKENGRKNGADDGKVN